MSFKMVLQIFSIPLLVQCGIQETTKENSALTVAAATIASVPTHAPISASFTDTDTTGGLIQGDVNISMASDESDVTEYVLYWGSSTSDKAVSTPIASIAKTGANLTYTFSTPTAIPTGATHLLVFTQNENGEMASGIYVAIVDKGVPVHAAVSASFTDTNTTGGIISGALTISPASDESDITEYVLYWGDASGNKVNNTRITDPIPKTGSNLIYTFTNTTLPANAVELLVKTSNADGEMGEGISAPIVDLGVPVHTAVSLSFTDLDTDGHEVQGDVTIVKALDESDITHYVLYWGSSSTTPTAAVTTPIAKTGSNLVYTFAANTPIPDGATHLIVHTKNADGEMATGVSLLIIDKGVPVHKAVIVNFTDTDTTTGTLTGDIVITRALDESDITNYVLYWGISSTVKQSETPIATIPKTGADVTYALSGTAKPVAASFIIALTANADGEMALGTFAAIYDLGVPTHAATSIAFTDSDTMANELTGVLTIGAASDESDLTHYVLYWGSNATTKKSGTPISTIAKTGSNVTYTFTTTAISGAPSSPATHFLVYTKNATGEIVTPFAAAIVEASPTVFAYTGSNQNFIVPTGISSITVYAWGGGGGGGVSTGGTGGGGGFIQATLSVTAGETLTVIVAGGGSRGTSTYFSPADEVPHWGAGGGGRSAIRRSSTELLTAAGGGGAAQGGAGGAGGGTIGQNSSGGCAQGGTQSAGGAGCVATGDTVSGVAGSQFTGGSGVGGSAGGYGGGGTGYYSASGIDEGSAGGGGGAGYYGGGSGSFNGSYTGGAGGSSYSSGTSVTNTAGSGKNPGNPSGDYYVTGIGKGGEGPLRDEDTGDDAPSTSGANGRVVIVY